MIKERYGVEAKMIRSGGGVYEIICGDEEVFSKKKTGRFPSDDEVFAKLDQLLGG